MGLWSFAAALCVHHTFVFVAHHPGMAECECESNNIISLVDSGHKQTTVSLVVCVCGPLSFRLGREEGGENDIGHVHV